MYAAGKSIEQYAAQIAGHWVNPHNNNRFVFTRYRKEKWIYTLDIYIHPSKKATRLYASIKINQEIHYLTVETMRYEIRLFGTHAWSLFIFIPPVETLKLVKNIVIISP